MKLTEGKRERHLVPPLEGEVATSSSGTEMLSVNNHVNYHPQTSVTNVKPFNFSFWRVPQSHGGYLNQGHSTLS